MNARETTAYYCDLCGRKHFDLEAGDFCCCCTKCKTPFKTEPKFGRVTECKACAYGTRLRDIRKRVRNRQDSLDSAEKELAKLLAEGRPPKGTVQG